MALTIVSVSVMMLCLQLKNADCMPTENVSTQGTPDEKITTFKIDMEKPITKVQSHFLSVAISIGDVQKKWKTMDFESPKLLNMFKALFPCYLRLGGSKANFLIFDDMNELDIDGASGNGTQSEPDNSDDEDENSLEPDDSESENGTTPTLPNNTSLPINSNGTDIESAAEPGSFNTSTASNSADNQTSPALENTGTLTEPNTTDNSANNESSNGLQNLTEPSNNSSSNVQNLSEPSGVFDNKDNEAFGEGSNTLSENQMQQKPNSESEKNLTESEEPSGSDGPPDVGGSENVTNAEKIGLTTAAPDLDDDDDDDQPKTNEPPSNSTNMPNNNAEQIKNPGGPENVNDTDSSYVTKNPDELQNSDDKKNPGGPANSDDIDASDAGTNGSKTTDGPVKRAMTPEQLAKFKEEKKLKNLNMKDFVMTAEDFDKMIEFANKARLRVLFDLNDFQRLDDGSWDPTNAEELLDYAADKCYRIDWQLGNEPNHYKKYGEHRILSGKQVGKDYHKCRKVLNEPRYNKCGKPLFVGPDPTRPREMNKETAWLSDFLSEAKNDIDALTWHQYYMDGKTARASDFIDPKQLNEFYKQNMRIRDLLKKEGLPKLPVWITETGSAWGGGAPNLSNRFVAGFPMLDKLGIAAQFGVKIVMRQTIVGGKYAMIDHKKGFDPLPDFFTSVLYKKLVGREVLAVSGAKRSGRLRVYAHCKKLREDTKSGVTIIALNLKNESVSFNAAPFQELRATAYILTAKGPTSRGVKLNGRLLKMVGDELPDLTSKTVVEQPFKMPPMSYGFFVIDYDTPVCQKKKKSGTRNLDDDEDE